MKKLLLVPFITLAILLCSVNSIAAQATSANKIVWDQQAATLAEAQSFTYKFYSDGSSVANTMTSVVCTGTTAPFTCSNNFPPFTPGTHTLTITASNAAGESAKSSPPFSFTFVVVPNVPNNLRIG